VRGRSAQCRSSAASTIPTNAPPEAEGCISSHHSLFHRLRSTAVENFNEQFKGILDAQDPVPTRGLVATRRFARGAVRVYQLLLWHHHEHGLAPRVGLKPALKAA
jgi:hypothetical protein